MVYRGSSGPIVNCEAIQVMTRNEVLCLPMFWISSFFLSALYYRPPSPSFFYNVFNEFNKAFGISFRMHTTDCFLIAYSFAHHIFTTQLTKNKFFPPTDLDQIETLVQLRSLD